MRPPSLQNFLIPVFALCATVLLSLLSETSLFATIPGYGREENSAVVALLGFAKPKVEIGIAEREGKMWVRVAVEEGGEGAEGTEASIMVPHSWHLEEVKSIHVREIESRDASPEMRELRLPLTAYRLPLTLVFTTTPTFDSLHFSHDSPSPALLSLTRLNLPEGAPERMLKFVEDSVTILL